MSQVCNSLFKQLDAIPKTKSSAERLKLLQDSLKVLAYFALQTSTGRFSAAVIAEIDGLTPELPREEKTARIQSLVRKLFFSIYQSDAPAVDQVWHTDLIYHMHAEADGNGGAPPPGRLEACPSTGFYSDNVSTVGGVLRKIDAFGEKDISSKERAVRICAVLKELTFYVAMSDAVAHDCREAWHGEVAELLRTEAEADK